MSPYFEYERAYEYVVNNKRDPFNLYVVIECSNEFIELDNQSWFGKNISSKLFGQNISREIIGNIAVCLDIGISLIFLLAVWIITYLVELDA
jgi:uncharacterized membrane protein